MFILRTPAEMQAWTRSKRFAGSTIGFVPTMGALH
ncbi:MAG: Pantoate-beta-alanine ligase, partial [Actinomycetota bacterium]